MPESSIEKKIHFISLDLRSENGNKRQSGREREQMEHFNSRFATTTINIRFVF